MYGEGATLIICYKLLDELLINKGDKRLLLYY
jgi:hypothetical protein